MPAAAVVTVGAIITVGAAAANAAINANQARIAGNRAKGQEAKADQAYEEMTKLANKQYERWEKDFGEIQTEVADYYKNLSDDILKQQYEDANTEANQSLVQQYFQAQYNIKSNMNKAGMAGSGAEQSSNLQLQQTMLAQKAQNRWQTQQLKANANNVLMGQKANWAQQGENLRSQAMQNQYNAEQIKSNAATANAQMYRQLQAQYNNQAISGSLNMLANMGGMMIGAGGKMHSAELLQQNPNNSTQTTDWDSFVAQTTGNMTTPTIQNQQLMNLQKSLNSSVGGVNLNDAYNRYQNNTFAASSSQTTNRYTPTLNKLGY